MSIVLGLDTGTSGAKAIAVDESGAIVASALVEYPLHTPRPGWAEQDPADWREAGFETLRRVAHALGERVRDVKALGLTGQMHGSVFLDSSGQVIREALLWCDQRTARQCEAITDRVGERKLIEMACNPALTGFTAPKILWLRDEEPRNYERVTKVLLPKDYIRYALTGEFAMDVADASGTLLFDVRNRTWHRDLMSKLDIDSSFVPPAYEGPEVTGKLTEQAAERTGLPAGLPVVAGGGDQAAGGVGCGIVKPGVLSSTVGTSGVVFAFSERVTLDPQGRIHTMCHAVPGKWHVMGCMLSAGGALRWFRDTLCDAERSVGALTHVDAYEYITQAAAQVGPGAEGLLFLPYLIGERTPHRDPYAKGAFIGLSLRHTRAHMARAVLEGVAYGMADGLAIIREMEVPVDEVRASGGGARSPLWRQIQADVYQRPMCVINVDEGPAYGAALLAAVGAGLFASVPEACDATVRVVDRCDPNPGNSLAYMEWFEEYRAAYRALAPGFRRCAEMLAG